jgi:hypothetical protein
MPGLGAVYHPMLMTTNPDSEREGAWGSHSCGRCLHPTRHLRLFVRCRRAIVNEIDGVGIIRRAEALHLIGKAPQIIESLISRGEAGRPTRRFPRALSRVQLVVASVEAAWSTI